MVSDIAFFLNPWSLNFSCSLWQCFWIYWKKSEPIVDDRSLNVISNISDNMAPWSVANYWGLITSQSSELSWFQHHNIVLKPSTSYYLSKLGVYEQWQLMNLAQHRSNFWTCFNYKIFPSYKTCETSNLTKFEFWILSLPRNNSLFSKIWINIIKGESKTARDAILKSTNGPNDDMMNIWRHSLPFQYQNTQIWQRLGLLQETTSRWHNKSLGQMHMGCAWKLQSKDLLCITLATLRRLKYRSLEHAINV